MDVCLINNHLPDFSFMSFSATLQLGLHGCHNSTWKCWNKLKTLHTVQSLVWQMKRQGKPKFYSYSSIQLCISCYAGNGDKGNANITYGFSCTWQAPNRTKAARTSLLCEVWETDRHGWKLIRLVLMCTVYKKHFRFPEVASSMQIVCYPSQGGKVFEPQFNQVSVGWMQDMRQRQ